MAIVKVKIIKIIIFDSMNGIAIIEYDNDHLLVFDFNILEDPDIPLFCNVSRVYGSRSEVGNGYVGRYDNNGNEIEQDDMWDAFHATWVEIYAEAQKRIIIEYKTQFGR